MVLNQYGCMLAVHPPNQALLVLMNVGISGGRNLCEVEVPLIAGEF
jgi:hypothetical protein